MRRVRFSPLRFIRWLLIMLLLWTSVEYVRSSILPQFLLYEQVRFEKTEVTLDVKPIVLWEEDILVAPIRGTVIPLVEEGKVVLEDTGIFEVKNEATMEKIIQDLGDVDRLIASFEEENSRLLKVKESRLAALGREYSQSVMIAKESALLYGLDSREYRETFKEMQSFESEWLDLDAEVAGLRRERDSLLERRESLRRLTSVSSVLVESRQGGFVSYQLDGLETKLDPDRFDLLSPSIYESLEASAHRTLGEVEAGEPVAKVTREDSQLLVMLVSDILFESGQSVTLYHQGIEHKLTVVGYREVEGGYFLGLKPVEPWVEPGIRFFSAELVVESRQGFVVSEKAITEIEGIPGVYVKEDIIEWRPVEVLAGTSIGLMVHGVEQGEWVINNPGLLRYLK